ncbi:hypothetical protein [Chryseobacterium sp. W4I1]|uniref:hypothetical protein n=1 Tax=Chryseobacterium sp. W4I1 TaxID=3042293 RepID=UPI00277F3F58|nr:hypothetical protein [Chryseobacterium sp. W4I1]MDQ0782769.1 hypothetical protein [Chryseobacterium sp. W4I1]
MKKFPLIILNFIIPSGFGNWVNLKIFSLNPKDKGVKLDLSNFQTYNGKANKDFKKSATFEFLGL